MNERSLDLQATIDDMLYHLTETQRRIANMIRPAVVVSFDPSGPSAIVDAGSAEEPLVLPPLRLGSHGGTGKHWQPLSPGQLVTVLAPHGDLANGYLVPAGYLDATSKPSTRNDEQVMGHGEGTQFGGVRTRQGGIVIHELGNVAKLYLHDQVADTWWTINPSALLPAIKPA